MWISKKKLERKIFEVQSKAEKDAWEREAEQRQNTRLYEIEQRVYKLEHKTGLKKEQKSCCGAVEIVESVF